MKDTPEIRTLCRAGILPLHFQKIKLEDAVLPLHSSSKLAGYLLISPVAILALACLHFPGWPRSTMGVHIDTEGSDMGDGSRHRRHRRVAGRHTLMQYRPLPRRLFWNPVPYKGTDVGTCPHCGTRYANCWIFFVDVDDVDEGSTETAPPLLPEEEVALIVYHHTDRVCWRLLYPLGERQNWRWNGRACIPMNHPWF